MNKKEDKYNEIISISFDSTLLSVDIEEIVPLKIIDKGLKKSRKYKQIIASIREVGIIEPLVVKLDSKSKKYILLDGHIRLEALRELEQSIIVCINASDDESYTYNKHVNRISPIQEHKMICRAIKRGVSEERIAKALNINVKNLMLKRNLLDGICPEAVDMLKDKLVAKGIFPVLKRMKAVRQIEVVTLMSDANIYTTAYVKALLVATPRDQLINPEIVKPAKGLSEEKIARMESEMQSLQKEFSLIESSYGENVLTLTIAKSYLSKLLDNTKILRYLVKYHQAVLSEFQKITEIESLNTVIDLD